MRRVLFLILSLPLLLQPAWAVRRVDVGESGRATVAALASGELVVCDAPGQLVARRRFGGGVISLSASPMAPVVTVLRLNMASAAEVPELVLERWRYDVDQLDQAPAELAAGAADLRIAGGGHAVLVAAPGQVRVIDLESLTLRRTIAVPGLTAGALDLALDPRDWYLAVAGANGLWVGRTDDDRLVPAEVRLSQGPAPRVAFADGGQTVIAGGNLALVSWPVTVALASPAPAAPVLAPVSPAEPPGGPGLVPVAPPPPPTFGDAPAPPEVPGEPDEAAEPAPPGAEADQPAAAVPGAAEPAAPEPANPDAPAAPGAPVEPAAPVAPAAPDVPTAPAAPGLPELVSPSVPGPLEMALGLLRPTAAFGVSSDPRFVYFAEGARLHMVQRADGQLHSSGEVRPGPATVADLGISRGYGRIVLLFADDQIVWYDPIRRQSTAAWPTLAGVGEGAAADLPAVAAPLPADRAGWLAALRRTLASPAMFAQRGEPLDFFVLDSGFGRLAELEAVGRQEGWQALVLALLATRLELPDEVPGPFRAVAGELARVDELQLRNVGPAAGLTPAELAAAVGPAVPTGTEHMTGDQVTWPVSRFGPLALPLDGDRFPPGASLILTAQWLEAWVAGR